MSKVSTKLYRSIGLLASGSIVGQFFNVALMPLVTRLYTPEEFGFYSVFVAIVAIAAVVACGRFEIAIPIPVGQMARNGIIAIAITLSLFSSLVILALSFALPSGIAERKLGGWLSDNLWVVALGVWVTSLYSVFNYVANRNKKFKNIAISKVVHVISTVLSQIAIAVLGLTSIGLFIGYVFGLFIAMVVLYSKRVALSLLLFRRRIKKITIYVWGNYKDYPKYSALDSLFNTVGIQLPIILIAILSVSSEAGFLMLAMKVMGAPLALLGTAIGHVYLSELTAEIKRNNIKNFTKRILFILIAVGVVPLSLLGLIAEPVFIFIFGEDWGRAGELVFWMTPWFIFQFLSSPISMIMPATNSQKSMLVLTMFGMIIRVGSVVVFGLCFDAYAVEAFAIASAAYYMLCMIVFYKKASGFIGVVSQ